MEQKTAGGPSRSPVRQRAHRAKEDIQEGFTNAPKTLLRLFEGKNFGKQLLKIADPPLGGPREAQCSLAT
jgi:hypothetical protein